MPKFKNVTADEIEALVATALGVLADARSYLGRCEQGYCDPLGSPIHKVRMLLSASRSLADMAFWLLSKAALDEQRRELEAELRARVKTTSEA